MDITFAIYQEKKCQLINFSAFLLLFNKASTETGNLF